MRRTDFLPSKKIRGTKRKMSAIRRLPETIKLNFISQYNGEPFWNYKIPVSNSLVNPPTSSRKIQAECIRLMLEAGTILAKLKKVKNGKVTVLITFPNMFSSEICVFFSEDDFRSFYSGKELAPLKTYSLAKRFDVEIPSNCKETGYTFRYEDEEETICEEWWCYSYCNPGNMINHQN